MGFKYLIESGMSTEKTTNVIDARKAAKDFLNQYSRVSKIYKIIPTGLQLFETWDVDWKKTTRTKNYYSVIKHQYKKALKCNECGHATTKKIQNKKSFDWCELHGNMTNKTFR